MFRSHSYFLLLLSSAHLLAHVEHVVHPLEALFPLPDFSMNCLPFFCSNLTHHVRLDDNFFVELVDLCIDDLGLDGFDGPLLNIVFVNLKQQRWLSNSCFLR